MNGLVCDTVPGKYLSRRNKAYEREVEKGIPCLNQRTWSYHLTPISCFLLRLVTKPYKEFEFCMKNSVLTRLTYIMCCSCEWKMHLPHSSLPYRGHSNGKSLQYYQISLKNLFHTKNPRKKRNIN